MIGDCFRFIHRLEPQKSLLTCVETGHEVVAGDEEAYARNKRCRLGLIDHALSHGKSPLTMFSQCLISRSKLVCQLIGDTVNKNEEHFWKYVNGKRFLHRLEQVERGPGTSGKTEKIQSQSRRVTKKTAKNKEDVNRDWTKYDHYGSATMIMKLKATIQSSEGQMSYVIEKSAKYAQIAAEEVPKTLYCLGGKLAERIYVVASKLTDNSLYHVCVFSDNIVATSVVVNSTALNSKAPEKVVFHLVTNAMKSWFAMNMDNLRGVTVEVQKFEDFKWLNASYVPVLKQLQDSDTQSYYFSGHNDDGRTPTKFRNPKYLSMLNHLNAQLYLFIRPYKLCYEDIKFL
ncbi:unnamed protein product [Brassica oleracea var. botrytis]